MRPKLLHLTTADVSLALLLGHQLERFRDSGFDVVAASAPGPYTDEIRSTGARFAPVEFLTRSWTPATDGRAVLELVNLFLREKPAIVHTHNPKSGVLGRVAARIARVPVVVNTVHGLYANPRLPAIKRFVIGRSERWAMRWSHHEFFQSQEDLERALREHMVRRRKASWLGNGVDMKRYDPGNVDRARVTALRRGWGALDDQRVVGAVGRLVREKGFLELFEAARILRREHPGAVVVCVGPEEHSKDDALSARDLALAARDGIVFHGTAPTDDMPAIHAAFDVFALPSYREGVPRSAIEASAMGRPVVATAIRGCREVVEHGSTGVLVPPGDVVALTDALIGLLDDPDRAAAMGEAGRERAVERFDEEAVIDRTLQVYRRLLAAHGLGWDGEVLDT